MKVFFQQWLRLWKMKEWWLFILAPYVLSSAILFEPVLPTWAAPIGFLLVSFFFTFGGLLLQKVYHP